ncbi:sensor histidine kinase [Lentilactobacillus sunkii]|uniref:histidine kinase n=1 Tax=Lentilactobacillus sunkii DSM 19904 TaxID=1423808 RepID=A0A0R1L100_9LACO|nr:HAMP domain-containing sensor histidine kinase [Lentilactobacillus sunkii]KRK89526.1 ATPase histidine kinase DNA gyrase B HSP90 domain protein [Lentilactobacillus sunkii DSM 19904]
MRRKKRQTTFQAIRHNFIILFSCFAFLTGTAVVIVVGVNLVHQRQTESVELLRSLNRSFIDDKPDWHQWRRNSSINTQDTYVRVSSQAISQEQSVLFYSKGAKQFLAAKPNEISKIIHLPFFPALIYAKGYGLFYYRSGVRHGDQKNIHSEIWISLNPIIKTLGSVVLVVIIVLILGLILGWFLISLIAKRLTRSLRLLQETAQQQSKSVTNVENLLPVPDSPTEVHELSASFNALLTAIIENNNKEKAFISNASHELRTPIAAIRGHISLVKRRGKEHPEIIDRSLNFIDDESAKMQALVNSLLALSRADKEVVEKSRFDLVGIVNETVEEERVVLKQPIKVIGEPSMMVVANQTNISQILSVLLDNAGKYSPKSADITVLIHQDNGQTTLSVQDTGASIADEDKQHIFDRFYRGDHAHNSQIAGNGLGLSIASQLAKLNNLTITVTDIQPQGVSFNVIFPKDGPLANQPN